MTQFCYVNGRYLTTRDATISIYDRSVQFADSVYEVVMLYKNKLIDFEDHLQRLNYSMSQIGLQELSTKNFFDVVISRLKKLNRINSGILYIQVSTGAIWPRNHLIKKTTQFSVIMTLVPLPSKKDESTKVLTMPDLRWSRVDIKSTSLLGNVSAKQKAFDQGAGEAVFFSDRLSITEGSHSNVWMVDDKGVLKTTPLHDKILAGITRKTIIKLAKNNGIDVQEVSFSLDEFRRAKEAFLSSSIAGITPICQIDDVVITSPGRLTKRLKTAYSEYICE